MQPKHSILAFDIGGTKIAAGIVDRQGKIRQYTAIATPHTAKKVIAAIVDLAKIFPRLPIGMGLAGQVSIKTGRWRLSSHIVKTRPTIAIQKELYKHLKQSIAIDNDAHCFALGEALFGAGKKYKNFIGITWGTGIGGGIIIDQRLYRGVHNTAGEVGHLMVPSGKSFVEWEHTCAGPQLALEYRRIAGHRRDNSDIISRWHHGERAATKAVTRIVERFGVGLASLANVLNPEAIIVGGGFGQIPGLVAMARPYFKKTALGTAVAATPALQSKLKKNAVLAGAAALQMGRNRL